MFPAVQQGSRSILWALFGLSQRGGSRSSLRTTEEPRGWNKAEVVEWARGGGGSAIPIAPGLLKASQTQVLEFVWVPWERFIILFFLLELANEPHSLPEAGPGCECGRKALTHFGSQSVPPHAQGLSSTSGLDGAGDPPTTRLPRVQSGNVEQWSLWERV